MQYLHLHVAVISIAVPLLATNAVSQDPISHFLELLFSAEQHIEKRKPARQSGDAGGDLLFGDRAEARLASSIQRYSEYVSHGGWPKIPEGPPLRPGDSDPRMPSLRSRLMAEGDLESSKVKNSSEYDDALVDAVIRFQTRNGLPNQGYLGRRTIAALNVSAASRLKQLKVNLPRIQSQRNLVTENRSVIVNIPAFELQALENRRVSFASRVVVGRKDRKTPTLAAQILAVNLLPTWRVPPGIAKGDMLPKLANDPDYFARENFRIVRAKDGIVVDPTSINWSASDIKQIRFEQAPGPNNALGLIRVDMPNPQIVYLHDTPLKKLFSQASRPFSSGCVRVERIAELALWLLSRQDEIGAEELGRTLKLGKSRNFPLVNPVPVHFVYYTAWVDSDGSVNFREDIYGKDDASSLASQYEQLVVPKQPLSP